MKRSFSICVILLYVVIMTGSRNLHSASPIGKSNMQLANLAPDIFQQDTVPKPVYTCSMHPEVISDKAGKCPKCGMNLTVKETPKEVYSCPMHSEVKSGKEGKCPKCGMNLAKKEDQKKEKK